MKTFSHYTSKEPNCFYTWEAHFGLIQKNKTITNRNKQTQTGQEWCRFSGEWSQSRTWSLLSASLTIGEDTQRRKSSVYTIDAAHRKARAQDWGNHFNQILHSPITILFHRLECQKARKENEARPSDSKLGAFHSAKAYSGDEQKPGSFQPEKTARSCVSSASCLSLTHLLPF